MPRFSLGIDYGTSHTVAMLRWPDGRVRPLLFDGSPTLPSAVYADADGRLLVGKDAERAARSAPARYEPHPKRRVDEGSLLLGDREWPVVDLVAATLRQVSEEAVRTSGEMPAIVLTHPAAWGPQRRALLVDAANRAGMTDAQLVPEPVAAARYFASVLARRVGDGGTVVVYDLGGGTVDVSVVRRTGDRFAVLACAGRDDFGGVDLDATVVDQVGAAVAATAPDEWRRLTHPASSGDRRHFRMLWDDARAAKESLSRRSSVAVHVPIVDRDVHVVREAFERAIAPHLAATAELVVATMRQAGTAGDVAGLFLVGGASRVPAVATTLHRVTGIAPIVIEQPELVVAEGALHTTVVQKAAADPVPVAAAPPAEAWPVADPVTAPSARTSMSPQQLRRRRVTITVLQLFALLVLGFGVAGRAVWLGVLGFILTLTVAVAGILLRAQQPARKPSGS